MAAWFVRPLEMGRHLTMRRSGELLSLSLLFFLSLPLSQFIKFPGIPASPLGTNSYTFAIMSYGARTY